MEGFSGIKRVFWNATRFCVDNYVARGRLGVGDKGLLSSQYKMSQIKTMKVAVGVGRNRQILGILRKHYDQDSVKRPVRIQIIE
jgi:hypothetical protein